MENIRVYEVPSCQMVASQCGMFGEGKLEKFNDWFSQFPRPLSPKDYLLFDKDQGGFVWYYIYDETMTVPEDFSVIDFPGGMYAVGTEVDNTDSTEVIQAIKTFIDKSPGLVEDTSRFYLGNIPTPPQAEALLGYNQMDYYVPVKAKE